MAGRFEVDMAALIVHDYEGDHECTTSFIVHWYGWRKFISSDCAGGVHSVHGRPVRGELIWPGAGNDCKAISEKTKLALCPFASSEA